MKFFGEISNNWPKDLLRINVYKTVEWLLKILQGTNTTSAISKWSTYSPLSFWVILFLVL